MEKRIVYSDVAIRKFYNHLLLKQKNNVNFEYEIRVDSEQIMPRTKDLSCFYSYRDFVLPQTETVEILLYKGLSRNYDKYIYELSEKKVTEVDIDKRISEELAKYKKELEFNQMTEKLEEYKTKNKELKERINSLEQEAKNGASMKDLMGLLSHSGLLTKITESQIPVGSINGISQTNETETKVEKTQTSVLAGYTDEQLIFVLNIYKDKLGEEAFQSLLGSCMQLGENPHLIPIVKQVIEEKINQK